MEGGHDPVVNAELHLVLAADDPLNVEHEVKGKEQRSKASDDEVEDGVSDEDAD